MNQARKDRRGAAHDIRWRELPEFAARVAEVEKDLGDISAALIARKNRRLVFTLSVKVDGEWVVKTDVGSPSEQPDDGDKLKAAFSDALKRAAIKLGIGRYLYRLPRQWCDYDPQRRQFKQPPLSLSIQVRQVLLLRVRGCIGGFCSRSRRTTSGA